MSSHPILARAPRVLTAIVLVLSGAYMLIYLYRWEWNRAIISGLFFVAAEVALAASMILRRLQRIEQGQAGAAEPSPYALDRLRSTPADHPDTFAWLKPRGDQLGVFIPVLLGAGAILSTLAYVIERVATATALPGVDRRLASRLAALAPPSQGLLGSRAASAPQATAGSPRHGGPAVLAATAVAVAAMAVVGWIGVQTLLEATQSRPDPTDRPERTTIQMSIAERRSPRGSTIAAEALWVSCRSTLGSLPVVGEVVALGGDRVALVLEPGIGRLSVRRLTGCLTDLQIDLVTASVEDVESLG